MAMAMDLILVLALGLPPSVLVGILKVELLSALPATLD